MNRMLISTLAVLLMLTGAAAPATADEVVLISSHTRDFIGADANATLPRSEYSVVQLAVQTATPEILALLIRHGATLPDRPATGPVARSFGRPVVLQVGLLGSWLVLSKSQRYSRSWNGRVIPTPVVAVASKNTASGATPLVRARVKVALMLE